MWSVSPVWQAGANAKQLITLDNAGPAGEGPLMLMLLQTKSLVGRSWKAALVLMLAQA